MIYKYLNSPQVDSWSIEVAASPAKSIMVHVAVFINKKMVFQGNYNPDHYERPEDFINQGVVQNWIEEEIKKIE